MHLDTHTLLSFWGLFGGKVPSHLPGPMPQCAGGSGYGEIRAEVGVILRAEGAALPRKARRRQK